MKDKIFKSLLFSASIFLLLLTAGFLYLLFVNSLPVFSKFGFWNFLISEQWDSSAEREQYGALTFIVGTLTTSILALLICLPFSLPIALFNGEYFKNTKIALWSGTIVDLLAGVPSIVYGLWGFYTLRPVLIKSELSGQGFGILLSSLVLAIMILPYASSLSKEFISMVSKELQESAYSLGATHWEVVRHVILPNAGSGIAASYMLAFGRALGETMAVTMLIGNTINIPHGLGDTGNTMASIIANQFGEAEGLKLNALFAVGLMLFLITAIVNFLAKQIIKLMN
ncbi:MAG: phosphate ABC transporter permease subunit PstC [Flavobacteriaceae bacterium]|jgi:phosphate transport system permease protein|nr:phosphate ABC transporter permease subunit PstC [Flavobacteriaceae bacterium]